MTKIFPNIDRESFESDILSFEIRDLFAINLFWGFVFADSISLLRQVRSRNGDHEIPLPANYCVYIQKF